MAIWTNSQQVHWQGSQGAYTRLLKENFAHQARLSNLLLLILQLLWRQASRGEKSCSKAAPFWLFVVCDSRFFSLEDNTWLVLEEATRDNHLCYSTCSHFAGTSHILYPNVAVEGSVPKAFSCIWSFAAVSFWLGEIQLLIQMSAFSFCPAVCYMFQIHPAFQKFPSLFSKAASNPYRSFPSLLRVLRLACGFWSPFAHGSAL